MTTIKTKRWQDLSDTQKIAIVMLSILQIALLMAALWDIRWRPVEQINGSKRFWVLISFINFFGPLTYFAVGRKKVTEGVVTS
jgi:drug/metabolite transporter (DMT)-like permease